MNAKNHLTTVATIFFVASAIGIVSQVLLFAVGQRVNIVSLGSSTLCGFAAYYLLQGSKVARYFLIVMAAISALIGLVFGVVLVGDGDASFMAFVLLSFGILMAYCFYVLQFSGAVKAELNRREADYQLKKERAKARYLQELEQENSRE